MLPVKYNSRAPTVIGLKSMVVIRLARAGKRKNPFYHLTVTDKRNPRDGRFIERVGYYNPIARGEAVRTSVNLERVDYWISVGAIPSPKVKSIIRNVRNAQVLSKQADPAEVTTATEDSTDQEETAADASVEEVAEEATEQTTDPVEEEAAEDTTDPVSEGPSEEPAEQVEGDVAETSEDQDAEEPSQEASEESADEESSTEPESELEDDSVEKEESEDSPDEDSKESSK